MEFAERLQQEIATASQLEILHPAILDHDIVVEEGVIGIRKDALYLAFARLAANFRSPEASLLALVATTEHVSAAAYRKELLVAGELSWAAELHILDVLLGSPLFKHAKSSVLWSHRRFIAQNHANITIEREWDIVRRAALAHPTNYYAWSYLRKVPGAAELAPDVWEFARFHLADVSIWTFLQWCFEQDQARYDYKGQAAELYNRYPHAAIKVYLRIK